MSRKGLAFSLLFVFLMALVGCDQGNNSRWAVTEDTRVEIDWDAVQEAYQKAEGPEDFEKRVNEIYLGDEIISVSVQDKDQTTQEVMGFFDKNTDGKADEGEKIFTISRVIEGDKKVNYNVNGHGPYAGYRHTGMWDIAAGVMVGSMISRAMMPGYTPVYTRPYVTTPARTAALQSSRSTYRAQHPEKKYTSTKGKTSTTGKTWGAKGSTWGKSSSSSSSSSRSTPKSSSRSSGWGKSGGGRFGIRRRKGLVVRL